MRAFRFFEHSFPYVLLEAISMAYLFVTLMRSVWLNPVRGLSLPASPSVWDGFDGVRLAWSNGWCVYMSWPQSCAMVFVFDISLCYVVLCLRWMLSAAGGIPQRVSWTFLSVTAIAGK
jgi:hypothetical protein